MISLAQPRVTMGMAPMQRRKDPIIVDTDEEFTNVKIDVKPRYKLENH